MPTGVQPPGSGRGRRTGHRAASAARGCPLGQSRPVEDNDEIGHAHGAETVEGQDGDAADIAARQLLGMPRLRGVRTVRGRSSSNAVGSSSTIEAAEHACSHETAPASAIARSSAPDRQARSGQLAVQALWQPLDHVIGTSPLHCVDHRRLVVEPGRSREADAVLCGELEPVESWNAPVGRLPSTADIRRSGWPSIKISPDVGSYILASSFTSVDFPRRSPRRPRPPRQPAGAA